MSKPWAPSHVSEVAKGLGIDLRISGEVKHSLVILLQSKLREITKQMEQIKIHNGDNYYYDYFQRWGINKYIMSKR